MQIKKKHTYDFFEEKEKKLCHHTSQGSDECYNCNFLRRHRKTNISTF